MLSALDQHIVRRFPADDRFRLRNEQELIAAGQASAPDAGATGNAGKSAAENRD
jgi:hypothetical protein